MCKNTNYYNAPDKSELPYFCQVVKVGILSDTHGYLHSRLFDFFQDVEEIWHAGDIGNLKTAEALEEFKPFRAVYGNIDGQEIRSRFPVSQFFTVEQAQVVMIHIGGSPGRYDQQAQQLIRHHRPTLFVCGHSHILKVKYDAKNKLLYINPGAAGKFGPHQSITAVRFAIDGNEFKDLEVLDLER